MESIRHSTIPTNGINLHVAEIGDGPAVLFLHGFPGLWYTWRHQMLFLSSKGYRAIAPDLRGYGGSDVPPSPSSYTIFHVVGDLVGLLDGLGVDKVFLVGHDWGSIVAWYFSLFRPDRVKALVSTSIEFKPRHPAVRTVDFLRQKLGDDFYIVKFQEPGLAEAEFAAADTSKLLTKIFTSRDPNPPRRSKGSAGFGTLPEDPIPLPPWLSEDDVKYYADAFDKTGFTGGLNHFRALDLNWELTGPWTAAEVGVPAKLIVGDLDISYNTPGVKEYVHGGGFKRDVPLLHEVVVLDGVAHFLNEESPHEVNRHIYNFIAKF
ncbi:hypothetical protein M569_12392 [Genlisea aurea]|uniref:soluble epoxide hydrolase n=1 Tax=Genlisea aurea TaxID=192259 RepID=S8C6J6_9LAMI|nr:hypothetical protein M569_12392 [Genlisea aurea]